MNALAKKEEMFPVHVDLSEHQFHLMTTAKELSGLTTKKDLIVNALLFFAWALKACFDGRKILALDEKTNRFAEFNMPALERASKLGAEDRANRNHEAAV